MKSSAMAAESGAVPKSGVKVAEKRSSLWILVSAVLLIGLIASTDWYAAVDLPLGFWYLLPMWMVGRVLTPWQMVFVAGICTYLTERYDEFTWNIRSGGPRDVLYFMAFWSIGVFVYEVNKNRRMLVQHLEEIELQSEARHEAEQQLHVLIESNPAAIITSDADGNVLMANEAAHRMLEVPSPELLGRKIYQYFPSLAHVIQRQTNPHRFRTVMQSRGVREGGDSFIADVSFSTYVMEDGIRLAAMILDTSEEMRTREESTLQQMLAGSRIAVSAVSHEVRNICGAIGAVQQNLSRNELLVGNKDFEALENLVTALERIAAVELLPYPEQTSEVDVASVLDDLKIVISPSLSDYDIQCVWKIAPNLPYVWADGTNLMQVFLNLMHNSVRVLAALDAERRLTVTATHKGAKIFVEVLDNGGGVADPEKLFRPFQPGAQNTGLGLYLARSFARSFGGDLRYKTTEGCASFVVELTVVSSLRDAK